MKKKTKIQLVLSGKVTKKSNSRLTQRQKNGKTKKKNSQVPPRMIGYEMHEYVNLEDYGAHF